MSNKLFKPLKEQIKVIQIKRQTINEDERKVLTEALISGEGLTELTELVNSVLTESEDFIVDEMSDEELNEWLEYNSFEANEENRHFIRENFETLKNNSILNESYSAEEVDAKALDTIIEADSSEFETYVDMLNEEAVNDLLCLLYENAEEDAAADTKRHAEEVVQNRNTAAEDKGIEKANKMALKDLNNERDAAKKELNKDIKKSTSVISNIKTRLDVNKDLKEKRQELKDRQKELKGKTDGASRKEYYENKQKIKDSKTSLLGGIIGKGKHKAEYDSAVSNKQVAAKKEARDKYVNAINNAKNKFKENTFKRDKDGNIIKRNQLHAEEEKRAEYVKSWENQPKNKTEIKLDLQDRYKDRADLKKKIADKKAPQEVANTPTEGTTVQKKKRGRPARQLLAGGPRVAVNNA